MMYSFQFEIGGSEACLDARLRRFDSFSNPRFNDGRLFFRLSSSARDSQAYRNRRRPVSRRHDVRRSPWPRRGARILLPTRPVLRNPSRCVWLVVFLCPYICLCHLLAFLRPPFFQMKFVGSVNLSQFVRAGTL